jgi:tetratricopeptide (TPR) repeat protein
MSCYWIMNCLDLYRFPGESVYFLDASSKETLETDLQTLVQSQSDIYTDALLWFSNTKRDWLVIMDNADDPSLELAQFLPRCTHGHVIITTRNHFRKILAPKSTYYVDALPLDESTILLLDISGYEDNVVNRELSENIARELGCLPLALAHAGAYILFRQCLDSYLETYRDSRTQLLERKFDMPHDYPYSVATTVEISFKKLSIQAQELLGLLSHLNASSIPRSIIEISAIRRFRHVEKQATETGTETIEYADILTRMMCPKGTWSSFEFDSMIEECEKYSLVRFSILDGSKFYSMHVLVQAFLQATCRSIQGRPPPRLVARLLGSAIIIGSPYDYILLNRLLSSHLRLVHLDDIIEPGDHYGYGVVLQEMGEGPLAAIHMERCVEIWRGSVGEESELTLDAMAILADSYSIAGKEADTLRLMEKVVETWRRIRGEDNVDTLSAAMKLANSYSRLGRYKESLPLMEEVLEKRRRLLGEDDLNTLAAMNNLAILYSNLRRDGEALPLRVEVLEKWRILLGEDHPRTLMAMNNLATSYSNLEREEEALPLAEEVVEKWRRLLGEGHLNILTAMNNLAILYLNLGRDEEALPLMEEVLEKWKRLLGEDHIDTLAAMNNLAISYSHLGRHEEALSLTEEVFEKWRRLLGEDHIDTVMVMSNLADLYSDLGKDEEAFPLKEKVIEKWTRMLGEDHLDTLMVLRNLAIAYSKLGRNEETLPLMEDGIKENGEVP